MSTDLRVARGSCNWVRMLEVRSEVKERKREMRSVVISEERVGWDQTERVSKRWEEGWWFSDKSSKIWERGSDVGGEVVKVAKVDRRLCEVEVHCWECKDSLQGNRRHDQDRRCK